MSTANCTLCAAAIVGAGRIVFECGHGVHLACGRPLVKAGADRCLVCARVAQATPAPAHPSALVVPLGNLAAQNQLVLHQMATNRTAQIAHRRRPVAEPPAKRGPCAAGRAECWGGHYCLHELRGVRSLAYFATACQYAYGDDCARSAQIAARAQLHFLTPGRPLAALAACGGAAEVLAFAGVTLPQLVARYAYTLEEICTDLALTWPLLLLLGFAPEHLNVPERYPLIALIRLLGVRGAHLVDFYRTRERLALCLTPDEAAVLKVNWAYFL